MSRLLSRRRVLSATLWSVPLLASSQIVQAASGGGTCLATAGQTEGPFYPNSPIEARSSLILPARGNEPLRGKQISVWGTVTDSRCRPLRNAEVEVWQADAQGRYNHSGQSNRGPLDARFLYWGKMVTDKDGNYQFATILPAPYRAGGNWMRPPHIHFKFKNGGAGSLTTQMYFPHHPLNEQDYLLQNVPIRHRSGLIARMLPGGAGAASPAYRFDVVL